MTNHDIILRDIHRRVKGAHKYKVGDLVLFIDVNNQLWPMVIEELMEVIVFNRYLVSSVDYPSVQRMVVYENNLRPMTRSRAEMKQLLKVV